VVCEGLGEDELLLRFFILSFARPVLILFSFSHWALIRYKVSLHTINLARITLSRSVFTAYYILRNNKIIFSEIGNTHYVQFNVLCFNSVSRRTPMNF
jgi:hypothetical protein